MSQKVHHFYYTVHRSEDPGPDPELLLGGAPIPRGANPIFSRKPYDIKEILVRRGAHQGCPLNPPLESIIWPTYSWKPNPGQWCSCTCWGCFWKKNPIWGWRHSGVHLRLRRWERYPSIRRTWLEIILKGDEAQSKNYCGNWDFPDIWSEIFVYWNEYGNFLKDFFRNWDFPIKTFCSVESLLPL